jgi:hypothetical protein
VHKLTGADVSAQEQEQEHAAVVHKLTGADVSHAAQEQDQEHAAVVNKLTGVEVPQLESLCGCEAVDVGGLGLGRVEPNVGPSVVVSLAWHARGHGGGLRCCQGSACAVHESRFSHLHRQSEF